MGFEGIVWKKLLRYYDIKALRSNSWVRKPDQQFVIPYCQSVSEAQSKNIVPYCLSNLVSSKKAAFTLAEVLITLGIIGIVAAMTIPTLIADYQKKVTATRLKTSYSKIMQVLNYAQNIDGADYQGFGLKNCLAASSNENLKTVCVKFFAENYILPNLKINRDYGITSLSSHGFPYYKDLKGEIDTDSVTYSNINSMYLVELSDGSVLQIHSGAVGDSTGIYGIIIGIDINGISGPNVIGKDLFFMTYYYDTNTLGMLGQRHGRQLSKELAAQICYSGGSINNKYCGVLIMLNDWQIPDDYPWF